MSMYADEGEERPEGVTVVVRTPAYQRMSARHTRDTISIAASRAES
jgi:hypothetical protein